MMMLLLLLLLSVMWSETVGLRTRPVSDQKIGLGLEKLVSFTSLVVEICGGGGGGGGGGNSSSSSNWSIF